MQLVLGLDDYRLHKHSERVPYAWRLHQVVNAHMLLVGKSGNGKTFTLISLIGQMAQAPDPPRIHIMDVHGDIGIAGASSVRFSESSPYGLNPLRISADPDYGGPRRRIQDFLATAGATRQLGTKQEAVLRTLLAELYAANGFYLTKAGSWGLADPAWHKPSSKKYPTLADCCRYAHNKHKQLALGGDSQAASLLDRLNKAVAGFNLRLKQSGSKALGPSDKDRLQDAIEKQREEVIQTYERYIRAIETGHELEQSLRYNSVDVIKSVCERLDNLQATGIFKDGTPPFDPASSIWRYDIAPLREEEKRLFVEFRLQEVFAHALEQGPVTGRLRHVIILDEAHLFFRDDPDNILNTIAKEGRKFGLALVCASQSPTHFSDDFVANVATKVVLGIDPMYWDGAIRKMRIELKTLRFIKPQHTLAVQMTLRGDTRPRFDMVNVAAGVWPEHA